MRPLRHKQALFVKNMKNKKILIIISLAIIIVITFLGWLVAVSGDEKEMAEYSQSILSAEEAEFNFGTINMQNGDVEHDFKIRILADYGGIITLARIKFRINQSADSIILLQRNFHFPQIRFPFSISRFSLGSTE